MDWIWSWARVREEEQEGCLDKIPAVCPSPRSRWGAVQRFRVDNGVVRPRAHLHHRHLHLQHLRQSICRHTNIKKFFFNISCPPTKTQSIYHPNVQTKGHIFCNPISPVRNRHQINTLQLGFGGTLKRASAAGVEECVKEFLSRQLKWSLDSLSRISFVSTKNCMGQPPSGRSLFGTPTICASIQLQNCLKACPSQVVGG